MTVPILSDIRERLAMCEPLLLDAGGVECAAVALVLREAAGDARSPAAEQHPSGSPLDVLLIERARHEADPWSGHIGLPGGRVDACDQDERAAAERETREELGLDLREAEHLGRLDDVRGVTLRIRVSAFVYLIAGPAASAPLTLSSEVAEAFWFPLVQLVDPARHGTRTFQFAGREVRLPAIDLVGPERPVLWGLTYRFLDRFLRASGAAGLPGEDAFGSQELRASD